MTSEGRRDLLLAVVLALCPVVAYAPAWREGRLLGPGDGVGLHLPLRAEAWKALGRGELPSWNPAAFSGTPLLAAYRPGALHPLMALLAPLDPFLAFQLLVLVSLALTASLTFLYARRIGSGRIGALLAALGFALGPYLVGHLGDTATISAAPHLVLALLALEVHLARGGAGRSVLLAAATALLLLAGSPHAVGAGSLLLGARVALGGRPGSRGPTIAALTAGALLAAPQLVPTLLALREAGAGADGLAETAASLPGLTGLVVRYVSHTPAPALALAAVPLVASAPPVRAAAALSVLLAALLALRGDVGARGAVALALDLVLALLAGLSLSAQWEDRRDHRGRRLRLLFLVTALASAAALSIAATAVGPLPAELGGAVGVLALAFILYFSLAESTSPVAARVFLLPLTAAFLLQPQGRGAWAGAPTAAELAAGTPTRQAIDRVLGMRRAERLLTLVERWPEALRDDLAYAGLGAFAGRRGANGYDPLAPAARREVFDGMGVDGTLPRSFLESDPGRLELLGIRWVQVPTAVLSAPAGAEGLGDALDIALDPARPHVFALPLVRATEVRLASFLSGAVAVPQGTAVAECVAHLASGREIWLPIRAGLETAEWAYERNDVRVAVQHRRAPVLSSFPVREGFLGHQYRGVLALGGRFWVESLRLRALPGAPPLTLLRAGLRDGETGAAVGVSAASGYLSDDVRLVPAALTPRVSLFAVRRGLGDAFVVPSLRRVESRARLMDLVRSPTRLGVDTRREALAVESDVAGVELPAGSRSAAADLARAVGGRLMVRAAGPGLLVVTEGWDAGWSVRVDGAPARALRVNGDRIGVVLAEGTHRVVLRHRPRGFGAGLLLAALGVAGLAVAALRERRGRGV